MKLELKDYQEEAASKVLYALRKGSQEYLEGQEFTAVSLSAPTGAGKTVIAAAVIERVLYGDPEGDIGADPDATFLWVTDDPSLNEQTRKKIRESSDRIQPSQLVTLDEGFDQPEFDRGRVYFLNIQKMARTANLVVRKEGRRKYILWETISRSIKNNGGHYYVVIDEAHRGTGKKPADAQTIVQRLMNGDGTVEAAPVLLGISATPERFEAAIASGAQPRLTRKWAVPVSSVRESGLIKDVLSIEYLGEKQTMETTLVRQAVANLRDMDAAWNDYTTAENGPPVRPALVMQMPDNSKPEDVGALLDVCIEEWPELGNRHAIAHSLESHTAEQYGRHTVMYIPPQDIQDHPAVRLVLFKQALTTGWDCPRAETMVSLRRAQDETYIAQLVGRMVRSPLARRIEQNVMLNRVRLYLPHFDRDAVENVKEKLEKDDTATAIEVEVNVVDVHRNKHVPAAAFEVVESLPSYEVPGPVHRSQVARLHKLAALLVGDGLLPGAISDADKFLIGILELEKARLESDKSLARLVQNVNTATTEGQDVEFGGSSRTWHGKYDIDTGDIDRLFAVARRRFRDGLADRYWGSRVTEHQDDPDDAKVLTIALSEDSSVVAKVESEAAQRVQQWLSTHGNAILNLSDDRQSKYAEVRSMARSPELISPTLPTGPIAMPGGDEVPSYPGHLYATAKGDFKARVNTWEKQVLQTEMNRPGFTAWYRNPTGGQRALRIPYSSGAIFGKLYPDFIFLHSEDGGDVRASIVDPHGHQYSDAGNKLRGLAEYAAQHGDVLARVLAVIQIEDGSYRALDLKDTSSRDALAGANSKDDIELVFTKYGIVYS